MSELYHPAEETQSDQPSEPSEVVKQPQDAIRVAAEFFHQGKDWATFYREVLGVDGVIRRMFPSSEEAKKFELTMEFAEIQQMVAKLRERSKQQSDSDEPTSVITVRLPKSLHQSLRAEAHQKRTSMNQLCISKLLQIIDNKLVPPG